MIRIRLLSDMKTLLTLLCFAISISHQAALEVKAGQYLGVDGANFVYNGERVSGRRGDTHCGIRSA